MSKSYRMENTKSGETLTAFLKRTQDKQNSLAWKKATFYKDKKRKIAWIK